MVPVCPAEVELVWVVSLQPPAGSLGWSRGPGLLPGEVGTLLGEVGKDSC